MRVIHRRSIPAALLTSLVLVSGAAALAQPQAPPTPSWLHDVTRVAYTDLGNMSLGGDWPEKVIEDLAAAGVQVFFSRSHNGASSEGLGWKSEFGDLAAGLKGGPVDWEVVGGSVTGDDAHSGARALKLAHSKGRTQTYINRRWVLGGGAQGAMLDRLEGKLSYWYKVLSAQDANLWLGAIPMSDTPLENTGAPRTGIEIPAEHIGDGLWHQVTIPYDYTDHSKVKWVHTSCFIHGTSAELLLDDIEYIGQGPQPITNGGFEELLPDRDGTREVTALCHKHGIRYLTYYWAQREPASLGQAHPQWRCRTSNGNPTAYYCVNTPYRDLVRSRIVELVKDVGVDGIFFDMFHARGSECYCEACRSKFRKLTGQDPPVKEDFDSPLWQEWVNFKYRSIEEALLDFNRAIKAANPEAALVVNTWNAWVYRNTHNIRNSIRVAECVDGLLEETGWYDTVDPSFFAFGARHNFMNWHLAGLCRGKRAFMWGAPSLAGWRTLDYQEPAIRVMTMLTNGCVPAHSVPGRDAMARYMADIAQREEYFTGSRLLPWCGLVVSEKTELWYGRDDPKERYVKGVYGAFQAALERHLPVALITDRDLELGRLEGCKVLFMPNCAAMSQAELETVRTFVAKGGGLVATYETSLYDEHARKRKRFGLNDLFNCKITGELDNRQMRIQWATSGTTAAHLQFTPEHPWAEDPIIRRTLTAGGVTVPPGRINGSIPLHCRMLLVEGQSNTHSSLRIAAVRPAESTKKPLRTDTPAVLQCAYGKGKAIYIPFDISWSFFRYGHEYLARMIELSLREAAPEPPPVEVDAPSIVQATPHLQGDRLVVHLLNDISSFGRSHNVPGESLYVRREVIPIHDIRLTFRDPDLKRFTLVPGKKALEATESTEGLVVTVPKLDAHAMVVAEP